MPELPDPAQPFEPLSEWLKGEGRACDVVVSSRVRYARNLAGHRFVNRADREERFEILDACRSQILSAPICERIMWVDLHETSTLERTLLVERHLISRQHARGSKLLGSKEPNPALGLGADDPRGVAVSIPDERLAIMINEEDHLRIQAIRSGLALDDAWAQVDAADDAIEAGLDLAYSPHFGYLTACPTNLGSGMRMSVMMHLPALKLTGDIEKVKRAAHDMNLAVRGFFGEGSEASGDFYQFSNQGALGKPEAVVLHELQSEIIPRVIEYERHARRTLLSKRSSQLEDIVFRALGLLKHARLLNAEEAMQSLSHLRLGVAAGLIGDVDLRLVNQLSLLCQPGHVQRALGRDLDQDQRRAARAELIRARLSRTT
jgi:protein arginine kinase